MLASTRARLFLLANAIGAAVLVIYGSRFRVDRRITFVPGEELGKYFRWELLEILLFPTVLLASVAGIVMAFSKPDRQSRNNRLLLVVTVLIMWIAAIWFDAHGRFLD